MCASLNWRPARFSRWTLPTAPSHYSRRENIAGTDELTCETGDAPAADSWDQWCESRDRRTDYMSKAVSAYVPPEMTGSEDLADPDNPVRHSCAALCRVLERVIV